MGEHKPGCDALGGYGNGVGPCTCGMTTDQTKTAEGWVTVPVDPTPAMLHAMWQDRDAFRGQSENKIARHHYALMLAAAPKVEPAQPGAWRCFHCDASFTDRDEAQEHFGRSEYSQPACQIDAKEYRAMEERMRRYNDEDSDLHRAMYGMQSDHQTALKREEEKGYARGLADAKKHPEELGLIAAPAQPPAKVEREGLTALRIHHEWSIRNMPGYSDDGDERVAYRATVAALSAPTFGEKGEGK